MQNHDPQPYQDDVQGYDTPSLPYVPFNTASEQPYVQSFAQETVSPRSEASADVSPTAQAKPVYAADQLASSVRGGPPTSPRKKRRVLWLVVGSAVAALILAVASFALEIYLNRSTPMKTLDVFCSALQKEDYQTAYDQFSQQLQAEIPEAVLAAALSQDKIISCQYGSASDTGNVVTTSLHLVHHSKGVNDDRVTLAKDKDGNWKIADLKKA
jgi:hypothetical protein